MSQRASGTLVALAFLGATGLAARAAGSPKDQAALAESRGCLSCHVKTDAPTMHASPSVRVSCVDCHGGNGSLRAAGTPGSRAYREAKQAGHVLPRNREIFKSAANPEQSYTALLDEDVAFVRFVNPGDLRVADVACGGCHEKEVRNVASSMMTHGAMLYSAALYNNGVMPGKDALFGESYAKDGSPRVARTVPSPTPEAVRLKGILPILYPLPRWEIGQPGNPLRAFEPGGRRRPDVGLPDVNAEAGRPDLSSSWRGPGTLNRIEPLVLGAQKTRLLDPLLSLLGTNDHPGDYRSSGCSACHVVYANDRSPVHSGAYAAFGNRGRSRSVDPTLDKKESGHPIGHVFTRGIPSSQCMTCHMHPGTNMVASFFGYTFWDNEVDGALLYPRESRRLSEAARDRIERSNPEGAALKGLWSEPEFLAELSALNPKLRNTQLADFHGHGWVFRAAYKRDRKGSLLDAKGAIVPPEDPARFAKAVHLRDIHLEKGMHCVDCHFAQDVHGDGMLRGETRAAVEIDCVDCHGTVDVKATLRTSGPASRGADLRMLLTPFGTPRFTRREGKLYQGSMLEDGREWEVPQVVDTITPGHPRYNERSRLAKTLRRDGRTWGSPGPATELAHAGSRMTCYACHASFTPSCFGCHLAQRANTRKPNLHNEGGETRNWTSYNFETLRDDVHFLAKDGTVTGNRIAPARSSCAIVVSSQNQDREWVYFQQPTVSSAGFAGTAFSTFVPHSVRATETRTCTDCHLSAEGDNNAWMASVLMQGTGLVNFVGRHVFVGEDEGGFEAVTVTERDEPQAVLGSRLHEIAYPEAYRAFVASGRRLPEAFHRGGRVLSLQARGEYLFAAEGKGGLRVYDTARIDDKGFAQRLLAAPVSGLGQTLRVPTKYASFVGLPTTLTLDPTRRVEPRNEERRVHPLYDFVFVADREEGLVRVGRLSRLLDGDPNNNHLEREGAFNPGGVLTGATSVTFAGTVAYVTTPRGLSLVDLDVPARPRLLATVGAPLRAPRAVAVQFRYAFVVDAEGLKVVDVTTPSSPRVVAGASVALADARAVTLARTYAYVAAGRQGLAIVDLERPEKPRLELAFTASGALTDAYDVEIGMTNGSAFAYVADGRNGLQVVQLVSANDTPGAYGFSPRPTPLLVATYKTGGPAIALSRGLDRDRAVDETGNQLAVFGRRGARPLDLAEQQRLYLRSGALYTVTERPPGPPQR